MSDIETQADADYKYDSEKCDADACYRVFWPGKPPSKKCGVCMLKATQIASAMGFHVHSEVIQL